MTTEQVGGRTELLAMAAGYILLSHFYSKGEEMKTREELDD